MYESTVRELKRMVSNINLMRHGKNYAVANPNENPIDFFSNVTRQIVLCEKTGVFYSEQVGGIACEHPVVEGFLIDVYDILDVPSGCEHGCFNMKKKERQKLGEDLEKAFREQEDYVLVMNAFLGIYQEQL